MYTGTVKCYSGSLVFQLARKTVTRILFFLLHKVQGGACAGGRSFALF